MKQVQMNVARRLDGVGESGFSLAEFLISTFILLVVSSAVFSMLAETQRSASYQSEVQAVMDNSRVALETIERIIRQAGNDPTRAGFSGLTITSPTQVTVVSDLTGSGSTIGQPDKGDPDGDTLDSGENVTIQYVAATRTINLIVNGNSQPFASYISAFNLQFFDAAGNATVNGADAKRARVSLTATTTLPHPQTGQVFGMQQACDIQIVNRT